MEHGSQLAFLDVLVSRNYDGSLTLSIYRKPTWSGLYTHYKSFAPMSYKTGLIRTLFHRANRICSPEVLPREREFLCRTLQLNGYPQQLIEKYSSLRPSDPQFGPKKKIVTLRVPFKGDAFLDQIRRTLTKEVNTVYSTVELRVIPVTRPQWRQNLKDSIPLEAESNVLYEFTCTCGSKYVGRTERRLSQRISEHVPRWLLNGEQRPKTSSAIARHLQRCSPTIPPRSCFRVMKRCRGRARLCVLEALIIKKVQPDLCIQKETVINLLLPW